MGQKILLLWFFLALSSCIMQVQTKRYNGIVGSQPNYCISATGYPIIIYYKIPSGKTDSVITTTLPPEFKIFGQKSVFRMRAFNSSVDAIACLQLFTIPRQMELFDVK